MGVMVSEVREVSSVSSGFRAERGEQDKSKWVLYLNEHTNRDYESMVSCHLDYISADYCL